VLVEWLSWGARLVGIPSPVDTVADDSVASLAVKFHTASAPGLFLIESLVEHKENMDGRGRI
jgi:hypothetical protein